MTDDNSVEDIAEHLVLMALIFQASKSLTKKMRHSFVLDIAGLSVKESMSLLGVQSTQVRNQRRRAIQKLRRELNDG
jgi:DNA-directed RNA polymerase specialized sigma24 family protein